MYCEVRRYPSERACLSVHATEVFWKACPNAPAALPFCFCLINLGRWEWKYGPCSGLACSLTATSW